MSGGFNRDRSVEVYLSAYLQTDPLMHLAAEPKAVPHVSVHPARHSEQYGHLGGLIRHVIFKLPP